MNNEELMLDVGQANEIKLAMRREGPWTNEEIKMLCERKGFLNQIRQVLLGRAEIKPIDYMIDCDSDPFLPDGWKMEEHKKGGQIQWNLEKVKLYLSSGQQNGRVIEGNKLRKELAKQPVLNANVLDFLLKKENQHLIPNEWKGKAIFFWGTIYRDSDGGLYVRCLYWGGDGWYWSYSWLGDEWGSNDPAVCLASN